MQICFFLGLIRESFFFFFFKWQMSQMSKRIRHAVTSKNPKKSDYFKKDELSVKKKLAY